VKLLEVNHHLGVTLSDNLEFSLVQPNCLNIKGHRKQRPHAEIKDSFVPFAFDVLVSHEVVEGALVAIHNQVIAVLSRKRNSLLSPPKDYVVDGVFKRRQLHHSASIAPMIG